MTLAERDEFWTWLSIGQERGWVSDGVCETHEGVPMSDGEVEEFDEGHDPCIPVIRVWL